VNISRSNTDPTIRRSALGSLALLRYAPLVAAMAVAAVLILSNLDNMYLWVDESYTAMLSLNVLRFGYPLAWDGRYVISVVNGLDLDSNYTVISHGWLPYYPVALAYLLLGASTFAGRLAMALFGLAAVPATYLLALRVSKNRSVANSTVLLLVLFVPFLLYSRQARYYPMVMFGAALFLAAYLSLLETERGRPWRGYWLLYVAAGVWNFQSHYAALFGLVPAIAVHLLIFGRRSYGSRYVISASMAIAAAAGLWLVFAPPWGYVGLQSEGRSFARAASNAAHYLSQINDYYFPLLFVPLLGLLLVRRAGRRLALSSGYTLCILVIGSMVAFLAFSSPSVYLRYLAATVPLYPLLMAGIAERLRAWRPAAAWAVLALFVLSNVWNILPWLGVRAAAAVLPAELPFVRALRDTAANNLVLRSWLAEYAYEITHDYDGPTEGIVTYLGRYAEPDDTVLTTYDWDSIAFYTGLRIINYYNRDDAAGAATWRSPYEADWVIPRKYWPPDTFGYMLGQPMADEAFWKHVEARYEKIVLPYPDIPWENDPQMWYHKFRTIENEDRVVIYKKPN